MARIWYNSDVNMLKYTPTTRSGQCADIGADNNCRAGMQTCRCLTNTVMSIWSILSTNMEYQYAVGFKYEVELQINMTDVSI